MVQKVIKRDGRIVRFDKSKIVIAVSKAMQASGNVDEKIAQEIADKVEKKLTASEVSVEDIHDKVEDALIELGNPILAKSYILYRAKRSELRTFKDKLGISDDLHFGMNSLSLLDKRYLKTRDGKKETPSQLFHRVAFAVAEAERKYGGDVNHWGKAFQNLMTTQMFMPSTPVLANAGLNQELSSFACFAFEIQDSMESVLQIAKDSGMVQKAGGGVGLHLSNIRPAGDSVASTEGVASGPISFMQIFDTITSVTLQGGLRRGGNLGLLKISHPDILEFIRCKTDENRLNNFNISVAITDDFMEAVHRKENFSLINPRNGRKAREIDANMLFSILVESAYRNGEPGIVFWDRVQKDNSTPTKGNLILNLCGEQPLLPSSACDLGSINLSKFVENKRIVYPSLRKVVHSAVRFLDNVLDVSYYPLEEIKKNCLADRRIGLGIMGFADALFLMEIPYASDEAIKVAEEIMSFIYSESQKASAKLAEERGSFPDIEMSTIKSPRRNAALCTLAPTGSISIISECLAGDTEINTLNGRFKIKDLVGTNPFVYSFKDGKPTIAKAAKVWMSKPNVPVIKIVFDDDTSIVCTPDHLIMKPDGSYKKATEMKIGESVMAFYKHMNSLGRIGIGITNKGFCSEQRIVAEYNIGRKMNKNECAHHIDGNKLNNNPNNIQVLTNSEHAKIQGRNGAIWAKEHITGKTFDELFGKERASEIKSSMKHIPWNKGRPWSSEEREKISERTKIGMAQPKARQKFEIGMANRRRIPKFCEICGSELGRYANRFCSHKCYGTAWRNGKVRLSNHRVKEIIFNYDIIDVYDMEIPETHNFVANNVFVHNCSGGIEPNYGIVFQRTNILNNQTLFEVNPVFESIAKREGWHDKGLVSRIIQNNGSVKNLSGIPEKWQKVFATALDISPEWHIKMQAAFQRNIDNACSKTINMPNEAIVEDVKNAIFLAYDLGLKGFTVFRDGSRSKQVLDTKCIECEDGICPLPEKE